MQFYCMHGWYAVWSHLYCPQATGASVGDQWAGFRWWNDSGNPCPTRLNLKLHSSMKYEIATSFVKKICWISINPLEPLWHRPLAPGLYSSVCTWWNFHGGTRHTNWTRVIQWFWRFRPSSCPKMVMLKWTFFTNGVVSEHYSPL